MADELEPFDSDKKNLIEDELIPDLDDAVIRIARMRKAQVLKCKSQAHEIAANSVRYYSNVTVECEAKVKTKTGFQGFDLYGPVDMSAVQDMSAFSKEMTSSLAELKHWRQSQTYTPATVNSTPSNARQRFPSRRFSRMKCPHLIPGCH